LHDQIQTQLDSHVADAGTSTLVVCGLGGAGKTQLVLDYVQRHRTEYKATFWIEAGAKDSLERDFIYLYQTLFGLTTAAKMETTRVDDAVSRVKGWFAGRQGPWLMVFDGADAIDDSEARGYIDIRHFIPDVASLHVIVTTRSSMAADMTRLDAVCVGEMDEAQAVELFYRHSRILRDDVGMKSEVKVIVKELGCLALAVMLAAAYVGTTPRLQSNIKAYLPEHRQRRQELFSRKPESLVHQYSESVLTTWETSHQAVADQSLLASVILSMLSFLSFDDIFLGLFRIREIERTMLTDSEAKQRDKIEECFRLLQQYSLVQWKADLQSYAIHKVVHAWGYDRLTRDDQRELSWATFGLVVDAVKAVQSSMTGPEDKLRLVPHVTANVATLGGGRGTWTELTKPILNKVEGLGLFLVHHEKWLDGGVVQELVLDERRRILGDEHFDTTTAMSNLARTLREQGLLGKAAKMFEEVVEKRGRTLGEEHPYTISAISDLASTLKYQGLLDKAAKMLKEVLEKKRRTLGEEHPDTITATNDLAVTLVDQGQLDEAVKMLEEVLEKRRRIFGEEHPDTIFAMNNLGAILLKQGLLDRVVKILEEVLEKRRRTLGEEHPDTISAISNLASRFREQGMLNKAAKMFKEVLEKRRRTIGEEHPDTITAINLVAVTLVDQGHLDEATEMLKEVLEKKRRIFGEEHLSTIVAMDNLGGTLVLQGLLDKAAELFEEVLEKRRRILGEEHPDTLLAISNLAGRLRDQGLVDKAAKMFKEVLEKRRRILGEEHLDTVIAMNDLASALRCQGLLDEAAKMFKEVLEKWKHTLKEDHPYTILAINNLAYTLADQGKLDEAVKTLKKLLEKRRDILGEEHPDTITTNHYLATIEAKVKMERWTRNIWIGVLVLVPLLIAYDAIAWYKKGV
jgi:tetratricopeptide (TPR) repeat protein